MDDSTGKKLKFIIKTFGCQMNLSDTERITTILEAIGYEKIDNANDADLVIFNTCSIKKRAEDKVFGALRAVQKIRETSKPDMIISITGCMVRQTGIQNDVLKVKEDRSNEIPEWRRTRAETLKKSGLKAKKGVDSILKRFPFIDMVFRIEDIAKIGDLLSEINPKLKLNKIVDEGTLDNYFKIAPKHSSKIQAFIPIMTGCDKFCTYCIVPFTRGREYSRSIDDVLKECTQLVENGTKEITLVGQTVNTYGLARKDRASGFFNEFYDKGGQISSAYRGNQEDESGIEKPFVTLLKKIDKLQKKGLKRLRYTSPHPRDFTDDVIDIITSLKTICPHIHMPVQSGSNTVLKRMNRNYTKKEFVDIINKMRIKKPNLIITTDIIVGFCSETEEEFMETYKMYEDLKWDFCYLSQYSPRKGTISERMFDDDISTKIKKERWHKMNELMMNQVYEKNKSYVGKTFEILVESFEDGFCKGRTEGSKEVKFPCEKNIVGEFINVKIIEALEWVLIGEIA